MDTTTRRTWTTHTILSVSPAPPGARIAYADPDEPGGIFYEPMYFVALCDEQVHEGVPGTRGQPVGQPLRAICGVAWDSDGLFRIAEAASNCLSILPPGIELDEADARVMAARAAAR